MKYKYKACLYYEVYKNDEEVNLLHWQYKLLPASIVLYPRYKQSTHLFLTSRIKLEFRKKRKKLIPSNTHTSSSPMNVNVKEKNNSI